MTGRLEIEPFAQVPCGARRESTRKATWLVQELFITLHSPLATLRSSERSTPNALVLFNSRSTLASSKNVLPNKPQLSRSSAKMVPIFPSLSLDQTGFNIEDFVGLLNRVLFSEPFGLYLCRQQPSLQQSNHLFQLVTRPHPARKK